MKINGMYVSQKKYTKKWIYISSLLFLSGVILGTIYCICLNDSSDASVNKYLMSYFNQLTTKSDNFGVLKNSLKSYIGGFLLVFLCAFARPGLLVIHSFVVIRGFILGFTTSAFFKYFASFGLLSSISSVPSFVVFVPTIIVFSSVASSFCINRQGTKNEGLRQYIMLSICCLAIFCVVSFLDAFVTTTFMKLFSSFFIKS